MYEDTQFPERWTVETMTDLFDDTSAAKGSEDTLTAKISAMDTAIAGKISSIPIASEDALGAVKIGSGISVASDGTISASGGSGGTSDYTQLSNLPQINSTALVGNKSSSDLGLQSAITSSAKLSADVVDDTSTTHKFVTASDKTTWSGKQDAIADLAAIRSGATAGATAVQTIKINGTAQTKTDGVVNLPAYPTTLPASNTVSTYSTTGTAPVNGKAVKAALDTLGASSVGGTGKYISAISETGGIIFATPSQIDSVPTENSTNPVASGGTYTALSGKASAADQAVDRAALIEIVDSGAKNLSQWNAGTGSGTIGSRVPISTNGGNFMVSFRSSASTGYITLGLKDANDETVAAVQINNSGTKIQEVEIPSNVVYFNVVSSVNAEYSNFMICTKAAWDISHAFQPYRPSYQELCDRVLNGGAS